MPPRKKSPGSPVPDDAVPSVAEPAVVEEGHFATWQAPYASAVAIEDALSDCVRHKVADPVTATTLIEVLGITPGHSPRIVNGLRCLGFLGPNGYYTERFYDFATASDDEARSDVMQSAIREAYAPVFERLGDNLDNVLQIQIVEAFGRARPESQRGRMVPTFKQLAQKYGLLSTASGRGAPSEFSGSVNRMLISATLGQDDSGEDLGSVTLQVAARLNSLDPRAGAFLNTIVRQMQLWVTGDWMAGATASEESIDSDALARAVVKVLQETGTLVSGSVGASTIEPALHSPARRTRAVRDREAGESLPSTVAARRNAWLEASSDRQPVESDVAPTAKRVMSRRKGGAEE